MEIRISTSLWAILFIASLALLLAGPLWQLSGLPGNTIDEQLHTHRSAAMYRAFEQDVYWPRWFPIVYNGLGAPTFHHYSPGLYWLVAAIHGTGIRLDQALKLVVTVALILSGFGAYAWLRYAFSPAASLAGAALYLLHPHILTRSYYYVGSYPRLLALLLLPVCLWAITALHMRSRIRYWLAAVVTLTALVFSHTLMTMVGACILALYWLLLAIVYRRPAGLLRCAVAALLAALLSAGYWLPALADLTLVQIDNARHGYFHFSSYFLEWWHLFSFQSPILDSRAGNPLMPLLSLGFGAASWLALAAGLASLYFVSRRERRFWGLAGVLFALTMIMLTLPVSEPLWETIPGLSLLQFPFRFLSIAPIGILPGAAAAIDAWPTGRRWLPALGLVIVSVLALFPYLFPAHTSLSSFRQIQTLTAEDTRQFERKSLAWGMTVSNEFLVRDADLDVVTGQTPEPSATQLTWRSPHEAVADLSGQTEPILLRLHFHPGWSAGERASLTPGPAGWMQVTDLSDPGQPLVIRWEGTAWQSWGERLSLVGLLVSLVGLLFIAFRRRRGEEAGGEREHITRHDLTAAKCPNTWSQRRPNSLHVKAMVGCIFVLVVVRYAVDQSSGGPFLLHSPPGRLAFAAEGPPVTLGDASSTQVTLLGWQLLSGSTPEPGGRVRVRLYWQAVGQIDEELHSIVHLYTPSLQRSWAVKNVGIGGRPDSQWWEPDKYYVDDLRLSLPADLPPLSYSLVAGLVTSDGERLNVPGSTDGLLHLRTLVVAPLRPGLFQRERPTTTARAATDDGLRLQGYDLFEESGGRTLRLFWETGDGVANDWITYIHLYDSGGARVAQFDGPALAGLQPTSQWHTNALYIDRRQLNLPAELKPGAYLLRIGLYSYASGERLPFQRDHEAQENFEDGQLLIPLTIAPFGGGPDRH